MPEQRHSLLSEGADVGIIGGVVVALWFLVFDLFVSHAFRTPSLLSQVILFGDRTPDPMRLVFGEIALYTAFHFLVFIIFGVALVGLVHLASRDSLARYALLPVFLAFEVMFYGLLLVLAQGTDALFPFWAVLGANAFAALAMGYYLWRRHPEFRRSIRETPLGDAPA